MRSVPLRGPPSAGAALAQECPLSNLALTEFFSQFDLAGSVTWPCSVFINPA